MVPAAPSSGSRPPLRPSQLRTPGRPPQHSSSGRPPALAAAAKLWRKLPGLAPARARSRLSGSSPSPPARALPPLRAARSAIWLYSHSPLLPAGGRSSGGYLVTSLGCAALRGTPSRQPIGRRAFRAAGRFECGGAASQWAAAAAPPFPTASLSPALFYAQTPSHGAGVE